MFMLTVSTTVCIIFSCVKIFNGVNFLIGITLLTR